jgi:hypothetical protein
VLPIRSQGRALPGRCFTSASARCALSFPRVLIGLVPQARVYRGDHRRSGKPGCLIPTPRYLPQHSTCLQSPLLYPLTDLGIHCFPRYPCTPPTRVILPTHGHRCLPAPLRPITPMPLARKSSLLCWHVRTPRPTTSHSRNAGACRHSPSPQAQQSFINPATQGLPDQFMQRWALGPLFSRRRDLSKL